MENKEQYCTAIKNEFLILGDEERKTIVKRSEIVSIHISDYEIFICMVHEKNIKIREDKYLKIVAAQLEDFLRGER